MWEGMTEMCGQQNIYVHIFLLRQQLIQIKQKPNQPITELVGSLRSKLEELAVYQTPTVKILSELHKKKKIKPRKCLFVPIIT